MPLKHSRQDWTWTRATAAESATVAFRKVISCSFALRIFPLAMQGRTLRLSGSPTQLNKEVRSWRVRSKRLAASQPTSSAAIHTNDLYGLAVNILDAKVH